MHNLEQMCWAVNSFSRSVGHMERRTASRMSLGNWSSVRSRWRCSRFSQAWMVRESSSMLAAFVGDKICLQSSRLLPAANGSYRAASLRPCSRPGSRSAPRTISRDSPSVLEIKKCCNSCHLVRHIEFMLKMCHRDRLLLVLCALHRLFQNGVHYAGRSPLPDMTKFSSSGRSSFRTGRVSKSSAPPTGRATSYPPYCEE